MKPSLGQLFIVGFDGLSLPNDGRRLLTDFDACGAILFKRNVESLEQVVLLNSQIVDMSKSKAIISVDQEGGRVARLGEICTPVMPMRELARLHLTKPTLPFRIAAMIGRELAALGFHLNFAPVVDVDSNPNNPVIGDRAFSSDPKVVAQLCAEFIAGMQGSGIAACAKHFPGHGDTHADSHLELPVLDHDMKRLEETELLPFKSAIAANVASIMTAHILLPQIDDVPATLSQRLLTDVLRNQLKYNGLIISDDLEMRGISDHYALQDILVKGLHAGVDLFLICSDTKRAEAAIVEVEKLVASGEINPAVIERAMARVQSFKERTVGTVAQPDVEYAKTIIRSKPHRDLMS